MPEITPQQLESIGNPQPQHPLQSTVPSALEEDANLGAEQQKTREEVRRLRLQNDDYATEIDSRRKYAKGLFRLVSWWIFSILVILVLQGFMGKGGLPLDMKYADMAHTSSEWKGVLHFELSENVLLALIGGTTAGVLGLFHIVAVHFFPEKK